MNNHETLTVLTIMATADHGCSTCVKHLFAKFLIKFPEQISLVNFVWNRDFEGQEADWEKIIEIIKDDDE